MVLHLSDDLSSRCRVTDDVGLLCRRGDLPHAVTVMQRRGPDFHRWRNAFNYVARVANAWLQGRELMWTESALREVVENVPDDRLQKELVLDARETRVRLDLGDPLPKWTARKLMEFADENDIDMGTLKRIARLPQRIGDLVDTGGLVLVSREMSKRHRARAQALWLELPDEEGEEPWEPRHEALARVAERSADAGARWKALSNVLIG